MAVTSESSAPYPPIGQIMEIINRYRDRGNPTVFNAESLERIGVPVTLISRILQAIKTLELVDNEYKPTKTFETIRLAPTDEYQKVLQEWLQAVYADVFLIVDAKDNETRIRDAFRGYTPTGQQGRMVSLFIGLCEEAGIREKSKKESKSRTRTPSVKGQMSVKRKRAKQPPAQTFAGKVPSAIAGLIDSLPSEKDGWTQQQHDKFMRTFGAVLDFCYPIVEENDTAQDVNNDDEQDDPN